MREGEVGKQKWCRGMLLQEEMGRKYSMEVGRVIRS